EPLTPLVGVSKLPAGHMMTVDVPRWRVEQRRDLWVVDAPGLDGGPGEAIGDRVGPLGPVGNHAQVPEGVARSGGLGADAGAEAAVAGRSSPNGVKAFALGSRGRRALDGGGEAEQLAAVLGMPYHEIELSERDVVSSFGRLSRAWNEPIADLAGFSYLAIAE